MGHLNCVEFVFAMLAAMPRRTVGADLPYVLLMGIGQLASASKLRKRQSRRRQASAMTGGRADMFKKLSSLGRLDSGGEGEPIPSDAPALLGLLSLLDMQAAHDDGTTLPQHTTAGADTSPVEPSADPWETFLTASSSAPVRPSTEASPRARVMFGEQASPPGPTEKQQAATRAKLRAKSQRGRTRRAIALVGELSALFTEIDSGATGFVTWEAFTAFLISAESMAHGSAGGETTLATAPTSIQYSTKPAWRDAVSRGDALRSTVWVPAAGSKGGELWTLELGAPRLKIYALGIRIHETLEIRAR